MSNKAQVNRNAPKVRRSKKFLKGDSVIVLTGSDKGKVGTILVVSDERVIVSGVNLRTKTQKLDAASNQTNGLLKIERPISLSNVAIYNANSKKADAVAFKFEDGNKRRVYKSSGEDIQISKAD